MAEGATATDLCRAVVDTMAEAVVVIDERHTVRLANRAFCRLCGIEEEAIRGGPLFGPHFRVSAEARLASLLSESARERRFLERVPVELHRPDGRRSLTLSSRALPADGLRPPLHLLTFSARAGRSAAREDAIEGVGKQVAEINHRVKNNLSSILAMLRLEGRDVVDAHSRDRLGRIAMRVQAIASLYELLAVEGRTGAVDLLVYFRALCRSIELLSGPGREGWTIEVTGSNVEVGADEALKYGAVLNELVANAAKYAFAATTRARGRIAVDVARTGDTVEILLTDNGIGLSPESLGPKSTGLGMRLVDLYLGALDGEIERTSAPNEGTTCRLRIPYRPPPRSTEASPAAPRTPPPCEREPPSTGAIAQG